MALRLSIVQIGKGTVGATLVEQVAAQRPAIRERLGVDLVHAGIAGRAAAAFDARGIDPAGWRQAVRPEADGPARRLVREAARAIPGPKVLVDATADEGMADLYCEAFASGFHVVTCNKKPLAGPLADYRRTQQAARAAGRFLLYEVTVGAGLPILGTLRDLLDGGDRVRSIEGCFSGTLNFLCAGLDRGGRFSEVLRRAKERGYTEPDTREDARRDWRSSRSRSASSRSADWRARATPRRSWRRSRRSTRRSPACGTRPRRGACAAATSPPWRTGAARGRARCRRTAPSAASPARRTSSPSGPSGTPIIRSWSRGRGRGRR